MAKMIKVDDEIRRILRECKVAERGTVVVLPAYRIERYADVKKALEGIGGKWDRKVGGIVFPKDVTREFEALRSDGETINEKYEFQAFYTPPEVVDRMISLARLEKGDRVLEPSAGDGRIALAAARHCQRVDAIEVRREECDKILAVAPENVVVQNFDFLSVRPDIIGPFDAILMNPPFAKQQDVDHVSHAIKFLRRAPRGNWDGGRLIAVMGAGFVTSPTKKAEALKAKLAEFSTVKFHDLPAGTFKSSGTNVRTVILEAW